MKTAARTNPPSRIRSNGVRISRYQYPEAVVTVSSGSPRSAITSRPRSSLVISWDTGRCHPRNCILTRSHKNMFDRLNGQIQKTLSPSESPCHVKTNTCFAAGVLRFVSSPDGDACPTIEHDNAGLNSLKSITCDYCDKPCS